MSPWGRSEPCSVARSNSWPGRSNVKHLDEGTLRRLYDDPGSIADQDRRHFAACGTCKEIFGRVAGDARHAAALLDGEEVVNAAPAFERMNRRRPAASPAPIVRLFTNRRSRRAIVVLVAACVGMTTAVVTGFAQNALNIFEPTHVAVIPVTTSAEGALPDLRQFGEMSWDGSSRLTPDTR